MGKIDFHEFFVSAPISLARHAAGRDSPASSAYSLFLMQSGSLRHRQFGREAEANTQALSLTDGRAAYSVSQSANFHSLVVTVPAGVLQARHGDLRAACVTAHSAHFGGPSVLWHFLLNTWQRREEIDDTEKNHLAAALVDLIGVLLPNDELPNLRQMDRTRTRLLDHISAQLPDPELGAASIAAALGISTRHVHTLMEGAGRTLSRYILEQRLEQSARALFNPLLAHLTITQIALQWGFNDMSHFSRAFRSRFGESPRTLRQRRMAMQKE